MTNYYLTNRPQNTQHSIKVRGRSGGVTGTASAAQLVTTAARPAAYNPNAVVFNGTTNYLAQTLGTVVDGKAFTILVAFRVVAGNGTSRTIYGNSGQKFTMRLKTDNTLQIKGIDTAGITVFDIVTTQTFLSGGPWHTVLISGDAAATSINCYVDNVSVSATIVNSTIDFQNGVFAIGATNTGTGFWNGALSMVFFATTYIDLSVRANLRKFIGPDGKIRNLGTDGSTPLGAQPAIFMNDVTATWKTNKGYAGGFTLNGAALVADTTGPNGALGTAITAYRSDDWLEFQGINLHVNNAGDAEWSSSAWHTFIGELKYRYGRSLCSTSFGQTTHITPLYNSYGVKFSHTVNASPAIIQDETFNVSKMQDEINILAAFGTKYFYAVEGPNEYQAKHLFERIFTVNTSTDILTYGVGVSTTKGYRSRTDANNNNQTTLAFNYANGDIIQFRKPTASTLPTSTPQIAVDHIYYVGSVSTNTHKVYTNLTDANAGTNAINFTAAGSGILVSSRWAPKLRAFQGALFTKVRSALPDAKILAPSPWGKVRIDYSALAADGGYSAVCDNLNAHVYPCCHPPDQYNRTSNLIGEPLALAYTDMDQMAPGKSIDETECSYNQSALAHPANNLSCTSPQVTSVYTLTSTYEKMKINRSGGKIIRTWPYALLDNPGADTDPPFGYFGLIYQTAGPTYTKRPMYYSIRNFNALMSDATWSGGSSGTWTYPSFSIVNGIADIDLQSNVDISYTLDQKTNGRYYLSVYRNYKLWVVGPSEETTIFTCSAATDILTVHSYLYANVATGDPVTVTSEGTIPTGLSFGSTGTMYYVNKSVTANQITLYDTKAHAVTGGATGKKDITNAQGASTHHIWPRKEILVTMSAPTFTSAKVWEPTMLLGETGDGKRDNVFQNIASPNIQQTLSVGSLLQIVEFIP